MSNVALKDGYTQVCVWPGTIVGADQAAELEQFFAKEMGVRVQYLEDVYTAPDMENGFPVEGTGGRCDCMFAVHNEDAIKFAIPRLQMGIRWLEDVYGNGHGALYPERIAAYQCWDHV
jgi:hypothetical protein